MSLAQILEEVEYLTDDERIELARRLRALELAGDAQRTADMSARLDRTLTATDVVTEEQLLSRLRTRGLARP
jgi:hypothetical protein